MDKRVFLANARFGRVVLGLFLIFILLFVMVFDVKAVITTRYAKPDGLITGECSSWASACTLQRALAVAVSGQEIWVAKGVHFPGTTRDDFFLMKNGVSVYGGFAGTETQLTERDWIANPTVLSGDVDHNDTLKDAIGIVTDVTGIQGGNAYNVLHGYEGDSNTIFDGFIINAGQADYYGGTGGGVYLNNCSPTLRNLIINANRAAWYGAGLYTSFGSPSLKNVAFRGNQTTDATYGWGGGMFTEWGSPTLTNVLFSGNRANLGGGFYSWGGGGFSPSLTNATFSGNYADNGGAIYINKDGTTLVNSIIWGNSSAIFVGDSGTANVGYSIIEGGLSGTFIQNVNPSFVNSVLPANAPTTAGNYHLRTDSPAIDAGYDDAVTATTDLDGNPRKFDVEGKGSTVVDMGAYEWTPHTLTISTDGSGTVTKNPDRSIFGYGEEVTLTATGATDWAFTNYTGDENTSENEFTLTITKDTSLTAHFIPLYHTLTINIDGNGSVSRNPDKSKYAYDEQVTLTAMGDNGWAFTHWTGDDTSTENVITVATLKDISLTAHFIKISKLFLPLITR